MKKLYAALYGVLLICAIGTVGFIILSPDRIPAHYNFAGEVDRIGSKYENLIWLGSAIGMGAFFLWMARLLRKKGDRMNEKILLISGLCTLGFFTLLGFYSMWKALRYDPEAAKSISYDDVNSFVSLGIGALLLVLGYLMPKVRRNAWFGLRTKWSLANDTVWQKSQRFGGMASVLAGSTMMILAMFVPGSWNLLVMTIVIAVWLILCVVASYRFYHEAQSGKGKEQK